jgi:PAS domain S-box-containing protein
LEQQVRWESSAPLNDSRTRLEAVLNNATVAIFLMDERQQCIYMNRAAETLTGFSLDEVLELDRPLHDIVHHHYPDGRPFPLCECAIDRAFPEHSQTQGEETFVHKKGYFYPVAFTASPIQDEASQTIGTIIEVRDISREKLAEERHRLLINELNHRVKNTLATIQSIAWLTFKGVAQSALSTFTGRLTALSKAHNVLTDSSWHGASLAEIVRVALDPFDLTRIRMSGPDIQIDPKLAVSLSMVLHELGTNATKYGALGSEQGYVSLQWSVQQAGEEDVLELFWHERGGPIVAPPVRDGFGTRLIKRQLAMEFGGTVEMNFDPTGLRCSMRLRLLDPSASTHGLKNEGARADEI